MRWLQRQSKLKQARRIVSIEIDFRNVSGFVRLKHFFDRVCEGGALWWYSDDKFERQGDSVGAKAGQACFEDDVRYHCTGSVNQTNEKIPMMNLMIIVVSRTIQPIVAHYDCQNDE